MLSVELRVDAPAGLSVRAFSVREGISSLFDVQVSAMSPLAALPFDDIVGRPAELRIRDPERGLDRAWHGLCAEITHGRAEVDGLCTYALRIVPALWPASLNRRSRTFSGMRAPEIAAAVLGGWGVEHRFEIDPGAHPPLEHRAQYEESDYAFLCRILEEAGISFYFHDAGGAMALVLTDAPEARAARPGALPYVAALTDVLPAEYVTAVRLARRVRPGLHALVDFDFRRPAAALDAAAPPAPEPVDAALAQHRWAPGSFLAGTDKGGGDTPFADAAGAYRALDARGAARATIAAEASASERRTLSYRTNVVDLAPGAVLTLSGHPRADLSGRRLLVTASVIAGTNRLVEGCAGEAAFADRPYRPALRTPKPRFRGVCTATVVAPADGEEIHTDEFGRVRVQLHWDRAGAPSCWVRVAQPWCGPGFGLAWIPRGNEEVLVAFQDGDPDLPVVVGRVHNGVERVPYPLPEHATRTVWRTRSTPFAGGSNEIFLDDRAGSELVYVQAERDLQKEVARDELEEALGSRSVDVTGELRVEARGRLVLRAGRAVIIDSGTKKPEGAEAPPAIRINCRADDEPFALAPPLPAGRSPDFAPLLRLAKRTEAGLRALETCARLGVGLRMASGSAAGFDPIAGAVLIPTRATPAAQLVALASGASRAAWNLGGHGAEPRRAFLSAEDLDELRLQEEAYAILRGRVAAQELEALGEDVSAIDLPLSEEADRARTHEARLAAITAGLRDGAAVLPDGGLFLEQRRAAGEAAS